MSFSQGFSAGYNIGDAWRRREEDDALKAQLRGLTPTPTEVASGEEAYNAGQQAYLNARALAGSDEGALAKVDADYAPVMEGLSRNRDAKAGTQYSVGTGERFKTFSDESAANDASTKARIGLYRQFGRDKEADEMVRNDMAGRTAKIQLEEATNASDRRKAVDAALSKVGRVGDYIDSEGNVNASPLTEEVAKRLGLHKLTNGEYLSRQASALAVGGALYLDKLEALQKQANAAVVKEAQMDVLRANSVGELSSALGARMGGIQFVEAPGKTGSTLGMKLPDGRVVPVPGVQGKSFDEIKASLATQLSDNPAEFIGLMEKLKTMAIQQQTANAQTLSAQASATSAGAMANYHNTLTSGIVGARGVGQQLEAANNRLAGMAPDDPNRGSVEQQIRGLTMRAETLNPQVNFGQFMPKGAAPDATTLQMRTAAIQAAEKSMESDAAFQKLRTSKNPEDRAAAEAILKQKMALYLPEELTVRGAGGNMGIANPSAPYAKATASVAAMLDGAGNKGLVPTSQIGGFDSAGYTSVDSAIAGAKRGDQKAKVMLQSYLDEGGLTQLERQRIKSAIGN